MARGRREYGHPKQLCLLVRSGFTSEPSAVWDTTPLALPPAAELLFLEAKPSKALEAVERLDWIDPPRYYMFARAINKWTRASDVRRDLDNSRI